MVSLPTILPPGLGAFTMLLDAALANLLTPMTLCFALGIFAGAVKSDLEIPEQFAKSLSLYLMLAIGLKGGWSLAESGVDWRAAAALLLAAAVSFLMPLPAYGFLRASGTGQADAAAISAHYGSISIVTFATGQQYLVAIGQSHEGILAAMVAVMETPAIITGILIARRVGAITPPSRQTGSHRDALLREVFFNGSVLLLLGGFLIGWATGPKAMASVGPFFIDPFKGALCIFLLDMGLLVARRARGFGSLKLAQIAFGFYMPLLGAALGLALSLPLGLSVGGATLFALLCASASYIAVPAAMRLAVPKANPALYVGLSLGVTFPFNVMIGVPLYHAVAQALIQG